MSHDMRNVQIIIVNIFIFFSFAVFDTNDSQLLGKCKITSKQCIFYAILEQALNNMHAEIFFNKSFVSHLCHQPNDVFLCNTTQKQTNKKIPRKCISSSSSNCITAFLLYYKHFFFSPCIYPILFGFASLFYVDTHFSRNCMANKKNLRMNIFSYCIFFC